MPAAHWIVGIGEIDQFRVQQARLLCEALRVLVIVQIWHGMDRATIASGMIMECWIGAERGENGVSWRNGEAGQSQ